MPSDQKPVVWLIRLDEFDRAVNHCTSEFRDDPTWRLFKYLVSPPVDSADMAAVARKEPFVIEILAAVIGQPLGRERLSAIAG